MGGSLITKHDKKGLFSQAFFVYRQRMRRMPAGLLFICFLKEFVNRDIQCLGDVEQNLQRAHRRIV